MKRNPSSFFQIIFIFVLFLRLAEVGPFSSFFFCFVCFFARAHRHPSANWFRRVSRILSLPFQANKRKTTRKRNQCRTVAVLNLKFASALEFSTKLGRNGAAFYWGVCLFFFQFSCWMLWVFLVSYLIINFASWTCAIAEGKLPFQRSNSYCFFMFNLTLLKC